MSRHRAYCFTINNYTEDDFTLLANLKHTYIITGYEGNDEGKTPHIQGFVYLKNAMTFTSLKKYLPRAHIEIKSRDSTFQQAADYCKKEGGYDEDGVLPTQGNRTDLANVAEMVKNNLSFKEIAETYPEQFIKFHRGIRELKNVLSTKRTTKPTVTVYYGTTGTGKSHSAFAQTKRPYVWGPEMGQWFDGYEGETEVIFEEFRGQLPFGMLLRLLDKYEVRLQMKGTSTNFNGTDIYITSPVHPRNWYTSLSSNEGRKDQLLRRIDKIIFLTKDNNGIYKETDVTKEKNIPSQGSGEEDEILSESD